MGTAQGPRPFVHLSTRYPVERGNLAIVWPLAPHPTNKNELIVWDLSRDPRELLGLDAEAVQRRLYTRQDALPAGELRLPIKTIHVNKSPIVIGNLKILGDAATRWGLDVAQALQHAEHAAALGRALDPLWKQVYARPNFDAADVDEDLYGGFINHDDRRTLNRLRELGGDQLAAKRPAFQDSRLDELLFRYRARNFAETLTDEERERWQQHCAERLHEGAGGATTLAAYFERIDALAEAAMARDDERAQGLLEALVDYGEAIAPDRT
jgi:exodeoxyribonuclease-1